MISNQRKSELLKFTKSLGVDIANLDLLNTALTHGSFIKEKNIKDLQDNERLEFFGDAVLKLCISEYLLTKYPYYYEGELSNLRGYVVSEVVLAKVADKLNIKKYLLLGENEKKILPLSIIANALEAILAVIYFETGLTKTKTFILKNWLEFIEKADSDKEKENFKAVLQEYTQGKKLGLPMYKTVSESGPEHKKIFEVAVYLNDAKLAIGKGNTKKSASQDAAKKVLSKLKTQQKIN